MKATLGMIKFFFISVPIFCVVYLFVISLYKIKELCGKK
jgi:hypothetical protein